MAKLSWGKPTIEVALLVNDEVPANAEWKKLPTPKNESTQLTATKGDEKTAQIEGGELLDIRFGAASYELTYELYKYTGMPTLPFTDNNGVIQGHYAVCITPEDPTCEGVLIGKSAVTVEESYNTTEGKLLKYTHKVLKPATGNMVKPYIVPTNESTTNG